MPSQRKYFFMSASTAAVGSPPCWWPRESCCWLGRGSAQSKLEPRPQCSPLLDLGRGESGQCLRPSVFDAVQGFFGGGVAVGQGQGGAEFGGGACAVALLFEQLSEHGVGFEGWAGFDGRLQVAAQQAHRQRIVAAGAEKHAGAVHERIGGGGGGGRSSGRDSIVVRACSISSKRLVRRKKMARFSHARAPPWLASMAARYSRSAAGSSLARSARRAVTQLAVAGSRRVMASAWACALSLPPPTMPGASR